MRAAKLEKMAQIIDRLTELSGESTPSLNKPKHELN